MTFQGSFVANAMSVLTESIPTFDFFCSLKLGIIYLKLTVSRLVPDFELDESWNVSQERRLGLESKPFSAATWRTNICKFLSHFSHFFL